MRFAPCNPVLLEGEALAWAAANRSAAFYQQGQHRQALEDIEIAIAAGYPTNTIYKLYIRRCKCELEMGRIAKAQAVGTSSCSPLSFFTLFGQMTYQKSVSFICICICRLLPRLSRQSNGAA